MGKTKEHATQRSELSPLPSPFSPLYKDRPMDIDILIYDDLEINEPDLKIPHPLMHEREFVMIPLREVRK
jgi:2-amino-4-hydroxy-6-hydroxymethyldihydropteridine diphosphokinase